MGQKNHTIKLSVSELFFDAQNKAYLNVRGTDAATQQAAYMRLTEDESESEQFYRSLSTAIAECVEALYPYTKMLCEDNGETSNAISRDSEYEVSLAFNDTLSKTTMTLITNLMHDYIVYRALADWFDLTAPGGGIAWHSRADAAMEQMRIRLHARCGRVRRTLSPF